MHKVSFVLPAYKRRFLHEAVASILAQTYRDFELVVVDDCSPEDLKSVVDEFHDDRLSYHRNAENIGGKDLVAAWNHAMEYARGEWCVLASDDDVYLPRYLETLMELVEKYPNCDLFHSRLAIIDAAGDWTGVGEERIEFETCVQMIYSRGVRRMTQMAPDFMFRLKAWQGIGGFVSFPKAWYTDDATWMRLAVNGVGCAPEVLFLFRQSGDNISTQYGDLYEKHLAAVRYKEWIAKWVSSVESKSSEDSFLIRDLIRRIHNEVDHLCCMEMSQNSFRSWIRNLLKSPVGKSLKFRFACDFALRPWCALRAFVGCALRRTRTP